MVEGVNVPGTVLGRLRSSAPHVESVRKDDMIRQRHVKRHLRDGFLNVQVMSRYVNFCHCESRVSNTSLQSNESFACTRDLVPDDLRFLPDVISRLKCYLGQNL